uniref:Uncharacterized protein n=1 Tax=Leersia perrieri TaxID=77586 RepID=A0A0D9WGW7_9ORYZ
MDVDDILTSKCELEIGCVNVRLHCGGAFSPSTATRSSAFLLVHLVSGRHHTTPNLIDCKAANV